MAMNMFNILETLCDTVHERFPTNKIYINQMPQGFERPSFYVSVVGFNDRDANKHTIERDIIFSIVHFSPVDQRGVVDAIAQYSSYMVLSQIFQHHGLKVKDRFIKITSVDGGPRDKEVYLNIRFGYKFNPEDFIDPESMYELMMNLQLKYQ